jgi:hypothetical protein
VSRSWGHSETPARGLHQRQSHGNGAPVLEQEVSQVVGGQGVLRLNGQRPLIERLGFLPIPLPFLDGSQRCIQCSVVGREGDGLAIVCECFGHIAETLVHLGEQNKGIQILFVELDAPQKRLLGVRRLLHGR